MFAAFNKASSPWLQKVLRHRAWILVGLTILFVVVVRVRLREMPLERDEGEYAYVGQLMLHGVPPYREAYAMKLPGTYAAYALIMAVFGQSASGIHLGLALVNAASIILMFLLGRRLLGEASGVTAAVAFALLSLSPSVMGLAAHATHFVVLAALGGILFLLRACGEEVQSPRSKVQSQGAEVQGPKSNVQSLRYDVQSQEPSSLTFHVSRFTLHAPLLVAGLLFGLAFLMKQHGLFFGLFGAVYLLRVRTGEWLAAAGANGRQPGIRNPRERSGFSLTGPASSAGLGRLVRDLGWFALGWLLPYGLTCLVLWWAGAFHQFVFWTITYAAQYASAIPIVRGPDVLRATLNAVVGPNLILWVLPWVGALVMWWESRLDGDSLRSKVQSLKSNIRSPRSEVEGEEAGARQSSIANRQSQIPCPRFFLTVLLFCSFASASVGLYFREHYFILVLPVLALLTGVAVSRGLYLLKHDQTIELFLAVPILGLFVIAVCAALIGHGAVWLALTPEQAIRSTYGSTLFAETVRVADYLKAHAAPDARVAVLGSEPEIYFYSRRRAATGHLYMYPLMEEHPYALKLQEQVIGEIERARPEYVIYVDDEYSWLTQPSSPQKLFEWWKDYWAANLDLVQTIGFQEGLARGMDMDKPPKEPPVPYHILILKRRS
jgi:Dolichyl-phosphate-mannose-protein mannosyltransferase